MIVFCVRPADHFDGGAGPPQNFDHRPGPVGDDGKAQNVRIERLDLGDGFIQGQAPAGGVEKGEFVAIGNAGGDAQHAQGMYFTALFL